MRRSLQLAATSPSRLLRAGQSSRCRRCGNRIDLYQRADLRPIALHPAELAVSQVPEICRWHLDQGIAHPHGDGSAWCRIPHAVLCPRRIPTSRISPHLQAARRQLALHTRRLIDTGAFTPDARPASPAEPIRPVVQILLAYYLADSPLEHIRCVAQTRHRHRCPRPVLAPDSPAGIWKLMPISPQRDQLPLPEALMVVYDTSSLPYAEQLRWRTQRCPVHAATPGAADLTLAGWRVFDPHRHTAHLHNRLPHHPAPSHEEE
ncbi:hypothetical protein SLNWT_0009 [Streptomyces albus]|uniref:Uncharacterized protein n=1 Tax=Streptomyces albus (strain ATCC 21838 / DSM 41398 / FERM P-419 / JCM 4703 / NBRC 107858) TaxID=1081613 RepID=A0A0B5EM15_STRA4|nr:hypothetical protein SLNWT_0009 [Streptomyces albus]AYN30511.1 hypothetical protein DUI70_0008 [Streptomyces albus]